MAQPDPHQIAPSKQPQLAATLTSRNTFGGWWSYLPAFELLPTGHTRIVGNSGIPGACGNTLRHQMAGLVYQIRTAEGVETEETAYYTLLLENARDAQGNVVGSSGLFDLLAQDVLTAHQGGNIEIVRVRGGRYDGVPVGLYAMDAEGLRRVGGENPIAQVNQAGQEVARFAEDEVLHISWNRYAQAALTWYNRHPVQQAWVAINALAAADDYNYSLLTEVIPQGLLNLGAGFDKKKALEWKQAWDAAKVSGKLEDIGLLWGTDRAEFIRFQDTIRDQPFQTMAYWYLTVVTACFEMSPLDLGFMTQINTRAAAETSVELSHNKGLRHLLRLIKLGVQHWVLPDGLVFEFQDIDPTDEDADAARRKTNTESLVLAMREGLLTLPQAVAEARRLQAFEIDDYDAEPVESESDAESVGRAWLPRAIRGIQDSVARCYATDYDHRACDHVLAKAEGDGEDFAVELTDDERALFEEFEAQAQAALVGVFAAAMTDISMPMVGEPSGTWAARVVGLVLQAASVTAVAAALVPAISALVQAGIEHGMVDIGVPFDFNVNDDAAQRFISAYGLRIAETVLQTTSDRLTATLMSGWDLGEDMDQLAARVRGVMEDIPAWRALTIARTETIRAFNGGMWLVYQESGLVLTKLWLDGQQGACPVCVDLHMEERALTDDFSIGVQFPPAHPRCRCSVRPGEIDVTRYRVD